MRLRSAALFAFAVPALALAADGPPPKPRTLTDLQACKGIADPAARLACYDRAMVAFDAATEAQQVVVIDRGEVRRARRGLFGFTLPRIGFLTGNDNDKDDNEDVSRLDTTITAARSTGYGKWRITIEGGAIWETTESDSRFATPKPGGHVLIVRGTLGSYTIKVGNSYAVKGKRVG